MLTPVTPNSLFILAKTHSQYGLANCQKVKFEQSQMIMKEKYETNLSLEDMPDQVTVNKVKPKDINEKCLSQKYIVLWKPKNIFKHVEVIEIRKNKNKKIKKKRKSSNFINIK